MSSQSQAFNEREYLPLIIISVWLGCIVVLFIIHKLIDNLTQIKGCIRLNIILIGILLLLLLPIEPVLYLCCIIWRQCIKNIHQESRDNLHEIFGNGVIPIIGISFIILHSFIKNEVSLGVSQVIIWVAIMIFIVGYFFSVAMIIKTGKLGFFKLNNNDTGAACFAAFCIMVPFSIILSILLIPLHLIILLSMSHDFVVELMNKINASFADFDVLDNNHHQQFWSLKRIYNIDNDINPYCNFVELLCGLIGWIVYFPLTILASICYGIAHISKDAFIFPHSMLIIPGLTSLTLLISSILYWSDAMREWYIITIYIISLLILAISSIFLGILYYHVHEGSFTSNNIVLIPGLFIIGPIQLLMLPNWPHSILNISWYLYDIISMNIHKAIGIYDIEQEYEQQLLLLLGNNDERKIEQEESGEVSQILSHISLTNPGATRGELDTERTTIDACCRICELFISLPFLIISYILLPISYLIEPMRNFRFQCFIMPFSFSMLFWICFIFWILNGWMFDHYIWFILWIASIICLFLLSIRDDPQLLKRLNTDIWRIIFPFLLFTYIITAPSVFLGIYWWPNWFIYRGYKCYKIIKEDKIKSDKLPFRFWNMNGLFVIHKNCTIFAVILFIILLPLTMLMMIIWFISIPTRSIIRLPIIYWIITIIMSLGFWFNIILLIDFDSLNIDYWNEYGILIGFILIYILIFAVLLTKRNLHDHYITKCMRTIRTIVGIIFFAPTLCAIAYYISWYYLLFVNSLI